VPGGIRSEIGGRYDDGRYDGTRGVANGSDNTGACGLRRQRGGEKNDWQGKAKHARLDSYDWK
jgi:hypothetical protein